MTDPAETIRRCDEGLARLATMRNRAATIRTAFVRQVRAQAIKDLERAERARRLDPWKMATK